MSIEMEFHSIRVKMVDFQGVCLRRSIRYEKSSAFRFRSVREKSRKHLIQHETLFSYLVISFSNGDVFERVQSSSHVCFTFVYHLLS